MVDLLKLIAPLLPVDDPPVSCVAVIVRRSRSPFRPYSGSDRNIYGYSGYIRRSAVVARRWWFRHGIVRSLAFLGRPHTRLRRPRICRRRRSQLSKPMRASSQWPVSEPVVQGASGTLVADPHDVELFGNACRRAGSS